MNDAPPAAAVCKIEDVGAPDEEPAFLVGMDSRRRVTLVQQSDHEVENGAGLAVELNIVCQCQWPHGRSEAGVVHI
ncbi:hypothetical protein AURDEDRAFT_116162 [Auricularia subglabra TFB-10046 SS5]|nr:hypothetical protein AURDEDRAFT_116162 [Auricularia subglabra TFB-10046 SS5]